MQNKEKGWIAANAVYLHGMEEKQLASFLICILKLYAQYLRSNIIYLKHHFTLS